MQHKIRITQRRQNTQQCFTSSLECRPIGTGLDDGALCMIHPAFLQQDPRVQQSETQHRSGPNYLNARGLLQVTTHILARTCSEH